MTASFRATTIYALIITSMLVGCARRPALTATGCGLFMALINILPLWITMIGRDLIRIIDDGCGVTRDDMPRAFLRHATSKIKTADDLWTVRTLGFRGEARSNRFERRGHRSVFGWRVGEARWFGSKKWAGRRPDENARADDSQSAEE